MYFEVDSLTEKTICKISNVRINFLVLLMDFLFCLIQEAAANLEKVTIKLIKKLDLFIFLQIKVKIVLRFRIFKKCQLQLSFLYLTDFYDLYVTNVAYLIFIMFSLILFYNDHF